MMLVVIEVEDWEDNDALLRELRVLQKSDENVKSDPDYDPDEDEGDETMRLKTDVCVLDVARIVGTLDQSAGVGERAAIRPLEA
jgi:hypothetical protein